ncbi:hypothetical protein [Massilia sp. YIM B04103]|uniref:hypothetical protein n=1 Tax=Massilia sp. YIM B04103 TaxID=2963106 RepID=UPI00210D9209|nr:hypothetical protein [Massilia sp. YIM B04103]
MSCKRIVVTGTALSGLTTTVSWKAPAITGLAGFLLTATEGGGVKNFDAAAGATSAILNFAADPSCVVTVTPKDASGPLNDMASAAAPVPFPPKPVDPQAGRPITIRFCADAAAGSVTLDWLASTIEYLEGYILTLIEGTSNLTNFDVPGAEVLTTTVNYKIDPGKQYTAILTPYDDLGPAKDSAAYPVSFPYPATRKPQRNAWTVEGLLASQPESALADQR